jgi:periplasmic copper chaperone A
MKRRTLVRAGFGALGVLAAAVIGTGPAWAHVTVNPKEATQGGYAKLAFRVPNEKDNASTVKLKVNIPTDAPIASVSIKPVAGWTAKTETAKLATPVKTDDGELTEGVSKITWTAANTAAGIAPGQFQEFEISAGPLPEVDQIVFKTLQTYSDGDIVRWIEEPAAGSAEPEHPAPALKLTKAADAGSAQQGAASNGPTVETAADTSTSSDSSGLGVGLGIAGLVAGLVGLTIGVLAWRKASNSGTTS